MKKLFCTRLQSGIGVVAALVAAPSPTSAAVIAQTFTIPLAPNTFNWGPDVQAGLIFRNKYYPMQWRIAPMAVDLDNNGTTDLTIVGRTGVIDTMRVSLTGRNEAWALGFLDLESYPLALPRGSQLGPSLTSDDPRVGWFNDTDSKSAGKLTIGDQGKPLQTYFKPDVPFEQKYLGVRFERDGALHYGWVGISGAANIGREIYIHAWAYESEPDTAIIVGQIPEPGAALLATAGGLLAALRRQRKTGT